MAEPHSLEHLCKALAMLDAVMSPDWTYRYFLYDSKWGAPADERMASLDNGSGDGYFLVFSSTGNFLKGFDHEAYMDAVGKRPPGGLAGSPGTEYQSLSNDFCGSPRST